MNILEVYTKKEYECKKCKGKIYYGKIAKDNGELYTTDGELPNGKFGKESNVLSGAVDATVQDRLHECSAHFVLDKIKEIESGTKSANLDDFDPEHIREDEKVLWNDIVAKVTEFTILAQKKLDKEYPEIENPALKGLITNNSFQVLAEIKRAQRGDSDE